MALVDRLSGIGLNPDAPGPGKLPVATFVASLVELANGQMTKAAIVSYFELDAGDESDLNWLIAQYNSRTTAEARDKFLQMLTHLFALAERRVPGYDTTAALAARIQTV